MTPRLSYHFPDSSPASPRFGDDSPGPATVPSAAGRGALPDPLDSVARWLAAPDGHGAERFSRVAIAALIPVVALVACVGIYRGAYRRGAHEALRHAGAQLELHQRLGERLAKGRYADGEVIALLQTRITKCEEALAKKAKRR